MEEKITSERRDKGGKNETVFLTKETGNFTVEEIRDFLSYENGGAHQGTYALIIHARKIAIDGTGVKTVEVHLL